MKSTKPSSDNPSHSTRFRTSARDYAKPVDYKHRFPSMARFAVFLALHYDANRPRHAYYRQLRFIHELRTY